MTLPVTVQGLKCKIFSCCQLLQWSSEEATVTDEFQSNVPKSALDQCGQQSAADNSGVKHKISTIWYAFAITICVYYVISVDMTKNRLFLWYLAIIPDNRHARESCFHWQQTRLQGSFCCSSSLCPTDIYMCALWSTLKFRPNSQ